MSVPFPRAAAVLLLPAGLLLAGCLGRPLEPAPEGTPPVVAPDPGRQTAAGPAREVVIDNFTFAPASLTVAPGTAVRWTNRDDVPHTVTSTTRPRLLESATLDTDDSFTHVFAAPGTYDYYCTVHPRMTGQVIVK